MQAIISARGLSISKTYKDALTRRLAKLEPMFPGIVEAKIVLSKEKHRRTAALSDQEIAQALHGQGLTIARRTVAKYREELAILPSHQRRLQAKKR